MNACLNKVAELSGWALANRKLGMVITTILLFIAPAAQAQAPVEPIPNAGQFLSRIQPPRYEDWFGPERLTNTMVLFLILTVLSLAPAIVIMVTSFVRIVIVLSVTRQALGTTTLPPNSVLNTIALFMTFHIMQPVAAEMYQKGIVPYSQGKIDANRMLSEILTPLRDFMAQQIELTRNQDDVWLFVDFNPSIDPEKVRDYDDVPMSSLLPAYMLSEIRTGFLIGFQLFLPFLVIDMAISSILVSMGMMMLPPVLVSLPFKLLLFVLVDGWTLIAELLLASFAPGAISTPAAISSMPR